MAGKKRPKDVRDPTPSDRAAFRKKFSDVPQAQGVSLKRDANGVFVHSNRVRSDSYPSADKIPVKAVKFVDSTG